MSGFHCARARRKAMRMEEDFETHVVEVDEGEAGQRLDRVLAARLEGLSRSRLQTLIRAGQVRCDDRVVTDPGDKVRAGSAYCVTVPPPEPAEPAGEDIPLRIVYEDGDLIVIDKPAGLVVHPAAGHASGTLVNALIAHCGDSLSGIGGVRRPGIVHRLDKDTSGLLVIAKNDAAHSGLSEQFASHGEDGRLHRVYQAFVWGEMARVSGMVDAPLGRSSANRIKIAVVSEDHGRHAVTHYSVGQTFRGPGEAAGGKKAPAVLVSRLRLELETGRTHQIRVHMAHLNHPLLGDLVYGSGFKASARLLTPDAREALNALGRQALHAAELGFVHPVSGEELSFESALPQDMSRLQDALGAMADLAG